MQAAHRERRIFMDVESVLRECGAMLEGHFLLSSGNHSGEYFQCARLLQFPQKANEVLRVPCAALEAQKKAGKLDYDIAVGPAIGGIIVAYEAARLLNIPAVFTERGEDGAMCLRRGFEIVPGTRVLITEDVITTGKSTLETARVLEEMGAVVTASLCVVDRRPPQTGEPFAWQIFSALRKQPVLFAPESCPLCKTGGLPLVKPGSRKQIQSA
jgi:orotate phosphoribosyltransferase